MTTQEETRNKILQLQRDFIIKCIEYQIAYGAESIGYNATADFKNVAL